MDPKILYTTTITVIVSMTPLEAFVKIWPGLAAILIAIMAMAVGLLLWYVPRGQKKKDNVGDEAPPHQEENDDDRFPGAGTASGTSLGPMSATAIPPNMATGANNNPPSAATVPETPPISLKRRLNMLNPTNLNAGGGVIRNVAHGIKQLDCPGASPFAGVFRPLSSDLFSGIFK